MHAEDVLPSPSDDGTTLDVRVRLPWDRDELVTGGGLEEEAAPIPATWLRDRLVFGQHDVEVAGPAGRIRPLRRRGRPCATGGLVAAWTGSRRGTWTRACCAT